MLASYIRLPVPTPLISRSSHSLPSLFSRVRRKIEAVDIVLSGKSRKGFQFFYFHFFSKRRLARVESHVENYVESHYVESHV